MDAVDMDIGYGGQCPLGMDIVVDNVAPDQGSESRIRIKDQDQAMQPFPFLLPQLHLFLPPSQATQPLPLMDPTTMSPFPVSH